MPNYLADLPVRNNQQWFLQTCPWALFKQPAIQDAFESHGWFDKGQLQMKYPRGVPSIVIRAVTAIHYGLREGERERHERGERERKRKANKS